MCTFKARLEIPVERTAVRLIALPPLYLNKELLDVGVFGL
jgi:hypothetical protein